MIYLLADIGGTNTRCAVTSEDGQPDKIQIFKNAEFRDPVTLLEKFLDSLEPDRKPVHGAIAVAGPVREDAVQMLNIGWYLSAGDLKNRLHLENLALMNDFEALATALPELDNDELRQVGPGTVLPGKPKAVIGPGTGLGVAGLVPVHDGWRAIGGEGGHVTLAAADDQEADIIGKIRNRFGHCSAERLISGPGLSLLHSVLHACPEFTAAELAELAVNGDRNANQTLEVFFRMLGTVAANLALTLGAFGGVYIGGGVIPRHAGKFVSSGFRKRFEAKGRYGDYLGSIPTFLIVAEQPTLKGLAAHARAEQDRRTAN